MITLNNKILFTCPTLTFTYTLIIIGISGTMYSNWSDLVRSTDMNRLLYWGIPGLPTLTVLRRVSRFQCKSHILTATQGNLTGSPFRYVNIYKCQSNGASDTDFLSPENSHWILLTAEEGGIFMRLNHIHTNYVSEGWWHHTSIEAVSCCPF